MTFWTTYSLFSYAFISVINRLCSKYVITTANIKDAAVTECRYYYKQNYQPFSTVAQG